MAEAWYCQLEGENVGPIDSAQLQALAKRGRVTPQTPVRTASGKNWVPASKVAGLKFAASEAAAGGPAPQVASTPQVAAASSPSEPATAASPAASAAPVAPKNPSTSTMRAPAGLKKAKLLEPGKSPAQSRRDAVGPQVGPPAEPTPPPPQHPPYGYAPEAPYPYGASAPYAPYPPPGAAGAPAPPYYPAPPDAPPAGQVVGIPAGIPVGVAVGAAPSPAAAPNAPWINVNASPNAASPAAAKSKGDAKPPVDRKAAARRKLFWMVGGVAGALLAITGVAATVALTGGSNDQVASQVAKKSLEEEVAETGTDEAGTPKDAAQTKADADTNDADGASPSDTPPPTADKPKGARKAASSGDVAAAIKAVSRWIDMSRMSAVTSPSMKLQVTGTWFEGSDPAGADSQRLFIELRVTNVQAEAPLNYVPWNGDGAGGGKTVALLATEDGRPCSFVSLAQASDSARQKSPVRLKPGQSLTDVVVFDVAGVESETLQLLLPTAAIGQAGRYLGFKIARDSIASSRPVELAGDSAPARTAPSKSRATSDEEPSKPVAAASGAAPAAAAPPAPAMREESIDDLKKSILDEAKTKQKQKDEEVGKMREATKKKPD